MLKQQLQLKLSQKLSPQQIQLMKLIQLSTLDLEQRIQSEIGENPALEKGKEIEVDSIPSDEYGDSQQDQNINTEDINIDMRRETKNKKDRARAGHENLVS